ncbi:hypothetical protein ACLB2K_007291 [Fragaria x ananassa]
MKARFAVYSIDASEDTFELMQQFKDLLQATRDGAITAKFNEWNKHGYLDLPRMVADLLATQGRAQKDPQPVLTEGPLETQTKTVREEDDNNSGRKADEEPVDSDKRDQA